jgi:hypothetical protein
VSMAIARVQSEFVESRISEASHRRSVGFAAVRRLSVRHGFVRTGGAPGRGAYAAVNGMTLAAFAGR